MSQNAFWHQALQLLKLYNRLSLRQ